ncbi:MAG: cob(I)yrinic acid a,c-diamide adenosyltransferase [Deltaproteobacteria bacterium]
MRAGDDQLEGGGALIQVYTGNGKGKTTAALGLGLRAAGAGLKVFIGQFLKKRNYAELNALRKIRNIELRQFGRRCFIKRSPACSDIRLARRGFEKIKKIVVSKDCDVVILDEINVALDLKLIPINEFIIFLKEAPQDVELILTGRNAHPAILKIADLVSEIKEKKHYYKKGVKARRGIEF